MGLDMYLHKRRYVKNWEHDTKNNWKITVTNNGKEIKDPMPISYVEYSAGYWRKANQIHNWFVRELADGVDECQTIYVQREDLERLLQEVNIVLGSTRLVKGRVHNGTQYKDGKSIAMYEEGEVLEDSTVAQKYLPTGEGFFFGSTEYNKWYWEDLLETKKICEQALESDDNCEFSYQASW